MAVCSFANQSRRYDGSFSGRYTGGPWKGVLHTTEGTSLPPYGGGASAPHFTLVPHLRTKTVTIYQHYNTNRPGRALLNEDGGVQTNNDSAVQIELVGTCDPRQHAKWAAAGYAHIYWPEAPKWALDALAKLMRWIEAQHGIPRKATSRPWLAYPASYGNSPARMGQREWDSFAGWCGHQHVAENHHGDPGNLNITYLISGAAPTTTVVKAGSTLAALAAALGLTVTALLSANPSLPATPGATVTPGTTITIPGPTITVTAPPKATPAPTKTTSSATSYRVVTTPASKRPILRKGTAGAAVKVVQKAVGAPVDGFFGDSTDKKVRAYQKARGLTVDGVVGNATWARILAKAAAVVTSKPNPASYPVLRRGAESRHVRTVQKAVGAKVDGDFGPATERAVRAFQSHNGLIRDGVVGKATWAAIL